MCNIYIHVHVCTCTCTHTRVCLMGKRSRHLWVYQSQKETHMYITSFYMYIIYRDTCTFQSQSTTGTCTYHEAYNGLYYHQIFFFYLTIGHFLCHFLRKSNWCYTQYMTMTETWWPLPPLVHGSVLEWDALFCIGTYMYMWTIIQTWGTKTCTCTLCVHRYQLSAHIHST